MPAWLGKTLPHVSICWCSSSSSWRRGLPALRAHLGRCHSSSPAEDGQADLQERAQAFRRWPGPVSAWQSYLPLSTLTYRATQGQPGLVPKGLHLSPEGLPHVSKICCCLWGRDEDWSESDLSLMLLANGPSLPAIAYTLSVRPREEVAEAGNDRL